MPPCFPQALRLYNRFLHARARLCPICASDDLPVGTISLRPLDASTAEVKRLWVAPTARGQGLARRLMQPIESRAKALGYSALKLDTNAALTEAISLYHATGWHDILA